MAVLNHIHINNFRVHRDIHIDNIDNFLALVGKNDVGKTSVLDALDFFFNSCSIPEDDIKSISKSVIIECTLDNSNVKKTYKKNKSSIDGVIPKIEFIRFDSEKYDDKEINDFTINDLLVVVNNQVERYLDKNYYMTQYRYHLQRQSLEKLFQSFDAILSLKDYLFPIFSNDTQETLCDFLSKSFDYNDRDFKKYAQTKDNELDLLDKFKQIRFFIIPSYRDVGTNEFFNRCIGGKSIRNILFNFTDFNDLSYTIKSKDKILSIFDDTIFIDNIDDLLNQWEVLLTGFKTNKSIKIGNRGSGVKRICSLYYHIMQSIMHSGCRKRKYIFAIDEPEISLHPEQQRVLVDILKQVTDSFDNIQIIITSHSPFILDKLNDNEIFVLPQKDNRKVKRCIKVDHSINETIYIAFNEPSIAYHQELFGYIHNVLMERYEKDIDNFKIEWDTNYKRPNNGLEVGSISAVDLWLKHYGVNDNYYWYNVKKNGDIIDEPNRSLPYCVRNYIDHPLKKDRSKPNNDAHNRAFENNKKYAKIELIQKSIEIMRKFIIDNTKYFS